MKQSISLNDEVEKLRKFRTHYKNNNMRGCINAYVIQLGGYSEVFKVFGGPAGFLSALKLAGYSKQYRSDLRKNFKNLQEK